MKLYPPLPRILSASMLLAVSLCAEAQLNALPPALTALHDSLKAVYAPDVRVARFDIDYAVCKGHVMVHGITTSGEACTALNGCLAQRGWTVIDDVKVLPDSMELEGKTCGIVNLSVANLHQINDFASEMQTQALLGMPVRVLQSDKWYRIQTPDRYIAWVHRAGIYPCTPAELSDWNKAEKVVVTAHFGFVYSKPDRRSATLSDVVAGNRLKLVGESGAFYHVVYPDGRQGYLPKTDGCSESRWRKTIHTDAQSLIATARSLTGVPYLWAGTSSKGVDCSGFVRTVLFMHDIIIPRDASQQAHKGEHIDIAPDFGNLKPGDLLFFGTKATTQQRERVVHVGIYIGDKKFIHSQGDVHISSLDSKDADFDAFNLNRLLYATRILPYIDSESDLNTTLTNPFYQPLHRTHHHE